MSRIARNSVNGRLNRNTFCCGAEVVPVQCKRGLKNTTIRSVYRFSLVGWELRSHLNFPYRISH